MKNCLFYKEENDGLGDEETGAPYRESLESRLLRTFSHSFVKNAGKDISLERVLCVSYQLYDEMNHGMFRSNDFRRCYEEARVSLHSYHAAALAMMMLYAINAEAGVAGMRHKPLMDEIERKFGSRPQMKELLATPSTFSKVDFAQQGDKTYIFINNNINMDDNKKAELLQGMFAGASFNNSVVVGVAEQGANVSYHANGATAQPKPTPEQLARALEANIGKGRAIDSQRAWLGACLLLGWKYGFPRNLQDCCRQVNQLPVDWTRVEYPCKYDNIRMFGSYKFVKEPVDDWPKLIPRDDERSVFVKCLDVSQELEKSIEQTMLTGVN